MNKKRKKREERMKRKKFQLVKEENGRKMMRSVCRLLE